MSVVEQKGSTKFADFENFAETLHVISRRRHSQPGVRQSYADLELKFARIVTTGNNAI